MAWRRNGDLLYAFKDVEEDMQLFWEAFPAATIPKGPRFCNPDP